jgi:hypothetical protein
MQQPWQSVSCWAGGEKLSLASESFFAGDEAMEGASGVRPLPAPGMGRPRPQGRGLPLFLRRKPTTRELQTVELQIIPQINKLEKGGTAI